MRLFIAEKPELGRAIAEGLEGSYKSGKGYIQKGNDIVTWAFGHILELAKPEEYDEKYKLWKLEDLPFPIKEFKYLPKKDSKEQLKIICDFINSNTIDSIVNCGDADDEGQILVDEIIMYSKTSKPVFRVLINDLTPKAVKEEIAKIKPNTDFKGMSERGFARSQADWIVGFNLTRAYTIQARQNGYTDKNSLSVGRVQTPILGLVVARDKEFEGFKSIDYFSLIGDFEINNNIFKARLKTEEKILDENIAKDIKNACESQNAKINLKIENKKEYPPLPYNLLVLQAECAKIFGFSPDKTLKITQDLREKHKAITYNRSDCQYLPETMFEEAPKILSSIKENLNNDEIEALIAGSDVKIKGKAFNDSNISAHYGIIPTQNKISSQLTKDELIVYDLIAKRFIIQFFNPREYQTTTIDLEINQRIFTTTQNRTTKSGFRSLWKNIDTEEEGESENNDCDLSALKNGDNAKCSLVQIEKRQTKPRPYYTMTTLLKDLNSVAKYVSDERIKKLLMEKDKDKKGESGGIGTPATRSNHIKTLIDRGYIEVSQDKKQVVKSTKKGRDLISLSPKSLTTPDMTALWFEQQKMIEALELDRKQFLDEVTKEVINEIQRISSNASFKILENGDKPKIQCPQCNKGFLTKRKGKYGDFWGCSEYNAGCKATYQDNKGKPNLNPKKESSPQTSEYQCPKCQKGFLIRKEGISKAGKPYILWSCNEWKNGCDYRCFEKDGKPNIS